MTRDVVMIGVDPAATHLAAVITYGRAWHIETRTMPTDIEGRCDKAERWSRRLVRSYGGGGLTQVYFFIEEPVAMPGRAGANSVIPQAIVHGALIVGAIRGGAIVVRVNNRRWKKVVVGNGNATAAIYKAHIKKVWPRLYVKANGNEDVCAAACINRYGKYHIEFKAKMRKRIAARERSRL